MMPATIYTQAFIGAGVRVDLQRETESSGMTDPGIPLTSFGLRYDIAYFSIAGCIL